MDFDVETNWDSVFTGDREGRTKVLEVRQSGQEGQRTFYTDTNGLFEMKREWNVHENWKGGQENQNVTENYYPVTAFIYQRSERGFLGMVPDRALGGTARPDGYMELMFARRLTSNDDRGQFMVLNDKGPDGEGMRIAAGFRASDDSYMRRLQFERDQHPSLMAARVKASPELNQMGASQEKFDLFNQKLVKVTMNYVEKDTHALVLRLQSFEQEPVIVDITKIAQRLTGWKDLKIKTMKLNLYEEEEQKYLPAEHSHEKFGLRYMDIFTFRISEKDDWVDTNEPGLFKKYEELSEGFRAQGASLQNDYLLFFGLFAVAALFGSVFSRKRKTPENNQEETARLQ
jgi:hypothetical protein